MVSLLWKDKRLNDWSKSKSGGSYLHWAASLTGCICLVLSLVGAELCMQRFITNRAKVKSDVTVMVEDLQWIPYSVTNPFPFLVAVQVTMGLLSFIVFGITSLVWKVLGLPTIPTMRQRLCKGRSPFGRWLGYIMEQYDSTLISGTLGHPTLLSGLVICGSVTLLSILNRYFWILCVRNTDAPFAQVTNYLFVICIPTFALWILREPLHGLKGVSTILCFIGIYIHFFGDHVRKSASIPTDLRVIGAIQGVGGAICLGLYLVFYSYFNPAGSMSFVLGCSGIGSGAMGASLIPFISWMSEKFYFSTSLTDYLLIFYSAVWAFFIHASMNLAIRWGQPTGPAAAIALAPITTAFISSLFHIRVDQKMTSSRFFSMGLTLTGFAVELLHQFVNAKQKRNRKYKAMEIHGRPEDLETEEQLLIGSEYSL